jgi:hypothetical protein
MMNKMEQSRARQTIFRSELMHTPTSAILSLDFRSSIVKLTLRELIMAIPSGDGTSLFHSIDDVWQGGYTFHYSPEYERVASMLANGGLLPYLLHTVSGELDVVKAELAKWFTLEEWKTPKNVDGMQKKSMWKTKLPML